MKKSNSTGSSACRGFGSLIVPIWKKIYKTSHEIGKQALPMAPLPEQVQEFIIEASEEAHDFVFHKNRQSWATIGPRALEANDAEAGTLVKDRLFVTAPLLYDELTVTIKKTGGKARTDVTICTTDAETGNKSHVVNHRFAQGKGLDTWTYKVRKTYGKSVSVYLRKRVGTNTFKYRIISDGKINMRKYAKTKKTSAVKKGVRAKKAATT